MSWIWRSKLLDIRSNPQTSFFFETLISLVWASSKFTFLERWVASSVSQIFPWIQNSKSFSRFRLSYKKRNIVCNPISRMFTVQKSQNQLFEKKVECKTSNWMNSPSLEFEQGKRRQLIPILTFQESISLNKIGCISQQKFASQKTWSTFFEINHQISTHTYKRIFWKRKFDLAKLH